MSSTNSKTSAARLPGSIPGIPTKPHKLRQTKISKGYLYYLGAFDIITLQEAEKRDPRGLY